MSLSIAEKRAAQLVEELAPLRSGVCVHTVQDVFTLRDRAPAQAVLWQLAHEGRGRNGWFTARTTAHLTDDGRANEHDELVPTDAFFAFAATTFKEARDKLGPDEQGVLDAMHKNRIGMRDPTLSRDTKYGFEATYLGGAVILDRTLSLEGITPVWFKGAVGWQALVSTVALQNEPC